MLSVHTCPLATLGGKETGGMNVYVRDLSRELGRRGFHVDVFTRSQDPCIPYVSHALGPNGRVVHIPAGPEAPIGKNAIYAHLPEFTRRVLDFAARERIRYDIIHSHYWLSGCVAEDLRGAWHVPFVQMFHTLGHMKNRVALRPEERESDLRIGVETEVICEADHLIAATQAEKAQLMWLYGADPDRITIIPPGVDVTHFRPLPRAEAKARIHVPPDGHMLLFVGRIEPLKGIDTLLRAVALLNAQAPPWMPQVCLAVIGGNPGPEGVAENEEMARLLELRQELGIGDIVTFLGAKDQDALPDYYAAADIVIVPSHYESFGLVALEAMACGTPVIASEVGGLAYLVKDGQTGFHVPYRDPEALAEKIMLLLNDPVLREKLGRQAVAYAQDYAWPRIADQVLDVYQGLLALPTASAFMREPCAAAR
jgi:D-inositol-3-phosphate glycosyltransferase